MEMSNVFTFTLSLQCGEKYQEFVLYRHKSQCNDNITSVPIHVELRVNHAEINLITHKFWVEHVHSRTHFSLKNVEHHHFSLFNCKSTRPNDFCSPEESEKSLF